MKSFKLWAAVLPVLLGAIACGGESSIGRGVGGSGNASHQGGASGGSGTGGKTGGLGASAATSTGNAGSGAADATGAGGATSSGAASQGGTSGSGGATMTGSVPQDGMCTAQSDCIQRPCDTCADGSVVCYKTYCAGTCHSEGPSCPTKCSVDTDCVQRDEWSCHQCADGTRHCPVGTCSEGWCSFSYTGCAIKDPCEGLSCGAACDSCATGVCVPEPTYCDRLGKCGTNKPSCDGDVACETAMDCGTPPPMCFECGDGSCASFACISKKCVFACPADSQRECEVSEDCPALEECKQPCSSTGKCPVQACMQGSCQPVCPLQ